MDLIDKIKKTAGQYTEQLVAYRRHLHQNPELSFQEKNTAAYVSRQLTEMGIPHQIMAGTGVVALIAGTNGTAVGKTVALRADMDALPIEEKNQKSYRSLVPGVMHACGHDAHTASLLGTAHILNQLRDHFAGTFKLIFQPGEEKNPGGASIMIKEGVLENPAPTAILGQHVFPLLPVGKVGFLSGKYMASADEIYLTVKGKGGHASVPELSIDPIVALAHILVAMQQIVSRKSGPKQPTVLTFGKLIAQGATNVIPDEAHAAGTFRAMNEKWRAEGLRWIEKTAVLIAESMGAVCEVVISHGYPCLENEPALTERMRVAATQYLGEENVVELEYTMGAEDFAYYSQRVPACFYRLGTRNEIRGITSYVHTDTFDIDEASLPIGSGLMAWLALQEIRTT